ncbi:MAG TPA: DUF2752 domain-containing protein [Myxococcaceae bacterium]|nr:DUF2752 domain-containing protein [Myxococcaceae bacterium]
MTITWPRPNRTVGFIDALALTGLTGLLIARFVPVARLPFWGCVLRQHTGWPCPGCGLTRAAERVAHFNVAGAWDANPLGTVAALSFAVMIVLSLLHLLFKMPLPTLAPSRREALVLRVALAALVLINYGYVILKTRFPALL